MAKKEQLSYACTPIESPYMYQTIPDRLRHLAAADPDREAFIYYDINQSRTSLTRKQLLDQSTHAAKVLVQSGLKKGTIVAFCMANSLEMLIANMGVIMAGGIPFYLSTNLKDGGDLVDVINDMQAEFLFLDTTGDDENWRMLNQIWPNGTERSKKVPSLKLVVCNGKSIKETEFRRHLLKYRSQTIELDTIKLPDIQPEDTLTYFCTSGSTGKPKEVTYTHYSVLNWTKFSNVAFGTQDSSVFFCDRTFSWVVGFPRTYLAEGATRVFVNPKMSLAGTHTTAICDIIEKENCDVVYLPGYLTIDMLLNQQLCTKFRNVQTIFLAGERVQKKNFESLRKDFCKRVLVYYGATECGGIGIYIPDTGTEMEDGIIGIPLQGAEMKVVDETGNVVPVGVTGELYVRSNWRFTGYRGMEEQFREAVDCQGWFHTGDIVRCRNDGNFVVEGRMKEMISTGSNKYFPWTVEHTLKKMKGSEHVFAVGVPEPRLKQVICACVFPVPGVSLTEDDVKKFCDETFLEESSSMGVSLKPRYFLILESVPLTPSGKLDRRTIANQAAEKLGLLPNSS